MSAIEDTIERIRHQDGVQGFFIVDDDGVLLRCKNLDKDYALEIANDVRGLVGNATHCVRDLDPTDELNFFRIKMKDLEVMAAPGSGFIAVVIQKWQPANEQEEK
eukprot:gb/GECG01016695.1/.p1 GENE.gb/GECG01016695.1/~~gb/GECG01016695.1/.p1  ORF type:complete len:105 (+),score=15.26 gb/GECG01016695.1/:1-315(+)